MTRRGQPEQPSRQAPAPTTSASPAPGSEPLDPAGIARWSAHLRRGTLPQRVRRARWALRLLGGILLVLIAAVVVSLLVRASRDSLSRVEQAVHEQRRLAPVETEDGEP